MSMATPAPPDVEEWGEYVLYSDRYDYPHFTDRPENPLMESSTHSRWVARLIEIVDTVHRDAGTDALVCGNTPFLPPDGWPQTAPDLLVVPGLEGVHVGRYVIGPDRPPPLVAVEVISESNTPAVIERRCGRWINAGIPEVYALDPLRNTFERCSWEGGQFRRVDALGQYSAGMRCTVLLVDGALAVCCVAGKPVRLDDRPYQWIADEQRRADTAALTAMAERDRADAERERADAERERADAERRRADELEQRLRDLDGG